MADIDRYELHTLVDHTSESDVPAVRNVLRALADSVELAILTALLDDEPETGKSEPPWPIHLPTFLLSSSDANGH